MNTIEFVGEHSRTYHVTQHSHPSWELVYCTFGEGQFSFDNGSVITYQAGDAVAIPPHLVHENESAEGFTNIHVRMADAIFPQQAAFRVTDDEDGHLRDTFRQAKYFYLLENSSSEMLLSALGDLMAGYMTVFSQKSEYSKPVESIRSIIQSKYSETDFDLENAIRKLPFHYDYMRKMFKKEVGITPLEYLTSLRMKKASAMLMASSAGEYAMSDIANTCGYSDALYFSRVFKKYHGVSPTAYQAEHHFSNSGK